MGETGPAGSLIHPPAARLDDLLAATAAAAPDRVALDGPGGRRTFGELDAAVTRCAAMLRRLAAPGDVVAVASVLEPGYVTTYYGALRAGLTVLPVVPMLREHQLAYVLSQSAARVAVLTAEMSALVEGMRAGLPGLGPVLPLDDLDALAAAAPPAPDLRPPSGPERPAALHFTSGTTGRPKCVAMSHRNLVCNALQIAEAHRLGPASISVVAFPTYHPMHMNSAIAAGARQVLHPHPDLVGALDVARREGATHLYALPSRLRLLLDDPNLPAEPVPTLGFVASGGSALPAAAARALSQRLGVPVIQGYGLAETSPLCHSDDPDAPTPGTVGRPLPDTECRTVDVDTRQALPSGSLGEVQVRGPQVMLGYLTAGSLDRGAIDADGWLSTGDVGIVDGSGRLRLVDRLDDVYKHDNFLVSPTEIEEVLAAHPEVADCLVLDVPHRTHGAVAHALVVLTPPVADERGDGERIEAVLAAVNAELPPFKHVSGAEVVESIPRSPIGKVSRRELRHALHTRLAGGSTMVVLINRFALTAAPEEFERVFEASSEFMRSQPGFIDHTLVRSLRNPAGYVNIAHWEDAESHMRVVSSPEFARHIGELATVAQAEPDLYAVVLETEHSRG